MTKSALAAVKWVNVCHFLYLTRFLENHFCVLYYNIKE